MKLRELPLLVFTPDSWAKEALTDILTLLNDHAHLEKKAAKNALELLPFWPEDEVGSEWVKLICAIARDEVQHLARVARIIEKRGGVLTRGHRSNYAQALRALVRNGKGPLEAMDRLMVSALIEARSCERFEILSRHAEDAELQRLYQSLWASEHGHYKVFLSLAKKLADQKECDRRWEFMLKEEAKIIKSQKPGSSIHSW